MYYRRKLLLNLIQTFGNALTSRQVQKLMFILSPKLNKPHYDFVPHRFGAYSFVIKSDLLNLEKNGLLYKSAQPSVWKLITHEIPELTPVDRRLMNDLAINFANLQESELIKHTYNEYPEYAVNSEIASQLLTEPEVKKIQAFKPKSDLSAIYTIGYEGLSLDAFVQILLMNDMQHLCDVRKNAYSMKFGFKKSELCKTLESVSITYSHHPELGIESEKRKIVQETGDWNQLFNEYEATISNNSTNLLPPILHLFENKKRIALMCFEHKSCNCHRGRLINVIQANKEINVINL